MCPTGRAGFVEGGGQEGNCEGLPHPRGAPVAERLPFVSDKSGNYPAAIRWGVAATGDGWAPAGCDNFLEPWGYAMDGGRAGGALSRISW